MPSWNIHIAQTENLLDRGGAVAHAVSDRNSFLFGNVVPDILVGYMVPGIEHPIPYRITHFASPEPIPKPREHEFWSTYVEPLVDELRSAPTQALSCIAPVQAPTIVEERAEMDRANFPEREQAERIDRAEPLAVASQASSLSQLDIKRSVLDMTLGAWAHLLADNLWNTRVNEYLDAHGGKPSEEFRIKKQGDFDWFGKTLRIISVPRATDRMIAAAEAFPQYPIGRRHVIATVGVIHEIVRTNGGNPNHPPYRLLTDAFFDETFHEVLDTTESALRERLG